MGLDIGPKTRELYAGKLRQAKTALWNGPMGVFEWSAFAEGTLVIARELTKVPKTQETIKAFQTACEKTPLTLSLPSGACAKSTARKACASSQRFCHFLSITAKSYTSRAIENSG